MTLTFHGELGLALHHAKLVVGLDGEGAGVLGKHRGHQQGAGRLRGGDLEVLGRMDLKPVAVPGDVGGRDALELHLQARGKI